MDIAPAPTYPPLIQVRGLELTVPSAAGPVNILSGIDLDVAPGEAVGIVGPSGSGKTSLLMILAGLEAATAGTVHVAGQDITRLPEDALARFRRGTVGIVFQSFHLIPTMTALENVSIPLELAADPNAAARAAESLRAVGLGHRLTHLPGQLSGGEQQRVALARAFAPRPRLLLADEPTGNLDAATGQNRHGPPLRPPPNPRHHAPPHHPRSRLGRPLPPPDQNCRRQDLGRGSGMIALTIARRELRTGVRGLRIVLACLALGVAAITAVGTLRAGITAGLEENGRAMLGGDLEIQSGAQPLPPELTTWLHAHAATTSDVVTMRSMLIAPNGERQLIELKAVDPAYPLVGAVDPASPKPGTISADQVILDRLAAKPGTPLRLGLATLTAGAPLINEPDRGAATGLFAPRALIALADLPATGLVQPGSLLNYDLRATLPPASSPAQLVQDLRKAFPEQSWRIRLSTEAAPGIARFIDQTSLFLTLVGLTALLVGGIGVATGIRAWLEARSRSIATLRCLGAPTSTIFATYLIQVAALCTIGIVLGVIAGAALTAAAEYVFRDSLPIPARIGLYPAPILLAVAYGLLVAAAFALYPLARAAQIPGAALFRDDLTPRTLKSHPLVLATNVAIAATLVALLVAASPDRAFAFWFCIAAAATLLLFRAGSSALMALARRAPIFQNVSTRLGIANLHRPGASTPLMLVSLGLGLTTLATVTLIQGNIRAQVLDQLPAVAPTFFFIDLQNDQVDRFKSILAAQPGVEQVAEVPSLRARLVSVNGVPADQVRATPETQWALRGDRGLTYAHAPPEGTHLAQGTWWPADYAGPPLVSFDATLAKGWNVHIGDTIRVNVLGRDIDLTVKNLRDIAWRSLSSTSPWSPPPACSSARLIAISRRSAPPNPPNPPPSAPSPTPSPTSPASASPTSSAPSRTSSASSPPPSPPPAPSPWPRAPWSWSVPWQPVNAAAPPTPWS